MKKLITTDLGGQPVYFKDFEFVQEMIRELAKSALGFNSDSIITILNGATYDLATDGYTIDILTEGWGWYNGEMFYIPVQSATGSNPNVLKWNITETNDPRGLKTFSDDTVGDKDVYLVRTLTLSYVPAAAGGVLFSATKQINFETNWSAVSPQAPWNGQFKYRINNAGDLEIAGTLTNAGAATVHAGVIYVFPEAYWPKIDLSLPVSTVSGTGISGELLLKTNGELIYYNQLYTTSVEIMFAHKFMLQAP